jgi:hypothetical protein
MEKIEKLIRLLYLEGYEDGKKQKKTPYKYTADSDKGKELYDYVEKQLDKAREEGRREGSEITSRYISDFVISESGKSGRKEILEYIEELSKLKQ